MLTAYTRGDYANALAMSDMAASCGSNEGVFRGDLLMQLGRFAEAEQTLAHALTLETEPKSTALANCVMGELFLHQQRYEHASSCFVTAVKLWPERGSTHRDIAEVWLRRGGNPTEALRWARLAVEKEKASQGFAPVTKVANLGAELATLAWAVAVCSRDAAEVERLVAEADSLCGGVPVSTIARVHVFCGMAYAALGDEAKRTQHFAAAARADANGIWGREAQMLTAPVCC